MTINILPLNVNNPLQNYIWLLVNEDTKEAIAVDPTDADCVLQYIQVHGLRLKAIWVTHDHHDHVAGVAALKNHDASVMIYAHPEHVLPVGHTQANSRDTSQEITLDVAIDEGSTFEVWGQRVSVWSLEGHKRYHVGYLLESHGKQHLFSGDIIFKAGCGRVFTGTLDELYDSLQRIAGLPDDAVLYPTHEFTVKNLEFALTVEPDSAVLQHAMAAAHATRRENKPTLPTTVAEEKRINPFLRVHETGVVSGVQREAGITGSAPRAVFAALRGLKDNF